MASGMPLIIGEDTREDRPSSLQRWLSRSVIVICVLAATGIACSNTMAQTIDSTSENPVEKIFKGFGGFLSNIFSPNGQKLKELIEAKKYREADAFYASEKAYFEEEHKTNEPLLRALADALNADCLPEIQIQTRRLEGLVSGFDASGVEWPGVHEAIAQAEHARSRYDEYELLKDSRYRADDVIHLEDTKARLKILYESNAIQAFRRFNHLADSNFFDAFPVSVNSSLVMQNGFDGVIAEFETAAAADIARFRVRYEKTILEPELIKLGNLYVARLLAERSNGAEGFYEKWSAVRSATNAGFKVSAVENFRTAIIQVIPDKTEGNSTSPKIASDAGVTVRAIKGADLIRFCSKCSQLSGSHSSGPGRCSKKDY